MQMKLKQSASVVALIASGLAGPDFSVQAATENGDPSLEEVVVTAQKREESVQKVPISISVLNGAGLDRNTLPNMSAIFNTVPGVATLPSFQAGSSQIIMRGVTANGALANQASTVAYYLDAVPFGFMRSAITPDPNPYDLAQVEVLRGPQGTLYGANALNGVMRVLTKDPDLNEFDLKARALTSSTERGGGNYGGDVAVNVPIVEGKLAARAVLGATDWSGWIDSQRRRNVNDSELRNYRLKLAAQPTDDLSIVLSGWRSDNEFGAPSNADDNNNNRAIHPQPLTQGYDAYSAKIVYDTSAFSLTSMTSYFDYKIESFVDVNPLLGVNANLNTNLRSKVFTQEVVATSNASGPWRWTAGGFYRDDKDRFFNYLNAAPAVLVPGAIRSNFADRSKSYAIYGELTRELLTDRLELTLGGRYFHDDATTQALQQIPGQPQVPLTPRGGTHKKSTPRVVLTWHPSDELSLYASYSEGFRSGAPQSQLVTFIVPDLAAARPDTLRNYELGAKGSLFDRRVTFDSAFYYIDWRDPQQTIGIIGQFGIISPANINGTSASGYGVDGSLKARLFEGVTAGLDISWNSLHSDTEVYSGGFLLFRDGQRLAYSPELTAGGSLGYDFAFGQSGFLGQFSASANYISSMTMNEAAASGVLWARGDAMWNVRTSFTIDMPEHWSVQLFADNLTDEDGSPGTTRPSRPSFQLRVRPRTVGMQLDYRFR